MSNDNETQIIYRALTEGFADAERQIKTMNSEVQATAGATNQLVPASNAATGALFQQATAHINVAEQAGLNRREMSLLFGEIGSVTGASPMLIQGLEGLAHGFGIVAIGVVGAVEVLKLMQSTYDNLYAPSKALNDALVEEAKKADDAAQQLAKLAEVEDRVAAHALTQAKGHADQIASLEKLTKAVENLKASQGFMADLARGDADATRIWQETVGALDDAIVKLNADIYTTKDANLRVTFEEETQAAYDLSAAITDAAGAQESFNRIMALGNKPTDASGRRPDSGADRMSGGLDDTTAGAGGTAFTELYVKGAAIRTDIANKEYQHNVSLWESEAKKWADFNTLLTDASLGASAQVQANFQLIANSAGDAALKTQELRAYIASLPADQKAKIDLAITFGGNTALAAALGMGGSGNVGRDFMQEMTLTFSQQAADIQKKFVDAAGGNKDTAAGDWMRSHGDELLAELKLNPGAFMNLPAGGAALPSALTSGPVGAASPAALSGAGASGGAGSSVLAGLQQSLSNANLAPDVLKGIQAHESDFVKAGGKMGDAVLSGLAAQIRDSVGDIATEFGRALTNWGDGRYIRQPRLFGVTQ